jgi:prolyl 4-hydroxylase
MKKIQLHEEIFIVEDFISSEECENFIAKSESIGFETATVKIDGVQQLFTGIRNNERVMFEDLILAESLWQRAKPFLVFQKGDYEAIDLNAMFRFYKYTVGQRFKMHRDGSFMRNETERSFYTFMIYLNDNFEGGETEFKDLFSVAPKKGSLLVFFHPLKHEGKVLLSGTKYVLRSDVMYRIKNEKNTHRW